MYKLFYCDSVSGLLGRIQRRQEHSSIKSPHRICKRRFLYYHNKPNDVMAVLVYRDNPDLLVIVIGPSGIQFREKSPKLFQNQTSAKREADNIYRQIVSITNLGIETSVTLFISFENCRKQCEGSNETARSRTCESHGYPITGVPLRKFKLDTCNWAPM